MESSDYIPVNKRKYIRKLVSLEAENKALKRKLRVYEDILKSKLSTKITPNTPPVDEHVYKMHDDSSPFKKTAQTFLNDPSKCEYLIPQIVSYISAPKNLGHVSRSDVVSFLQSF